MSASDCFIFITEASASKRMSLTLSVDGVIDAPLQTRTADEIRALQIKLKTTLVLPCALFSIYAIKLPLLSEKKAHNALLYALEDKLSQPIEEIHISFDKHYYHDGHYWVAVCDKLQIKNILDALDSDALTVDHITIDWFALSPHETLIMEEGLLINDPSFNGFLPHELSAFYLTSMQDQHLFLTTEQRYPDLAAKTVSTLNEACKIWIAKRVQQRPSLNISSENCKPCESQKQHNWLIAALIMAGICSLTWLLAQMFYVYSAHQHVAQVDKEIASIYHVFFPTSTSVISPRFRVEQLLKANKNKENTQFWTLLNELAIAQKSIDFSVLSLQFQDASMHLTVTSNNFASLDKLQTLLKQAGLTIGKTHVSSRDHDVISNMVLTL